MKDWILSAAPAGGGFASTGFLALRVLLAAFFLLMAFKNLSGDPQLAADFQRWGYSDAFRRFTAGLQIVGAVALCVPATCFLGAALLAGVLVGAAATHALHDPVRATLSPLVFLALAVVVLVRYRPEALR